MFSRIAFIVLLLASLSVGSASTSLGAETRIDINVATQAQLETLPGIGPALALRIIQYREENGSFKRIEELMDVRGIGEKKFHSLQDLVTVEEVKESPEETGDEGTPD